MRALLFSFSLSQLAAATGNMAEPGRTGSLEMGFLAVEKERDKAGRD
jgi:hypothetical protein